MYGKCVIVLGSFFRYLYTFGSRFQMQQILALMQQMYLLSQFIFCLCFCKQRMCLLSLPNHTNVVLLQFVLYASSVQMLLRHIIIGIKYVHVCGIIFFDSLFLIGIFMNYYIQHYSVNDTNLK